MNVNNSAYIFSSLPLVNIRNNIVDIAKVVTPRTPVLIEFAIFSATSLAF